ncbi:MAG: hydroxymethylglutaryl-CoA reductase, degradative [Candidatus Thermoplasmatota archaeon]
MSSKDSRLSGFHKKSLDERIELVKENTELDEESVESLVKQGLSNEDADMMIENVIGTYELPVGVATNFKINGEDRLIPMVIEESSVVAAASYGAKLARESGGFKATTTKPVMISQIQVTGLSDPHAAKLELIEKKEELKELANEQDPVLVEHGGGVEDIRCRVLESRFGPYLVVHLLVDCRDAMGANAVNTMAEALAPRVEELTGGKVYLRILSNLAEHRLARARAVWSKKDLGEDVVEGIVQAYEFARIDPYRCATHNKGVMNGVTAVVSATGNDTRAVESGAHSYAASGGYSPLTTWEKTENNDLVGTIEIPVPVGVIGGATSSHPGAQSNLDILGVEDAQELGEVIASVGLAQNFAALRALASEGIQKGHMKLHAKNVAVQAGAEGDEIEKVASKMIEEENVRADRAEEILEELRG